MTVIICFASFWSRWVLVTEVTSPKPCDQSAACGLARASACGLACQQLNNLQRGQRERWVARLVNIPSACQVGGVSEVLLARFFDQLPADFIDYLGPKLMRQLQRTAVALDCHEHNVVELLQQRAYVLRFRLQEQGRAIGVGSSLVRGICESTVMRRVGSAFQFYNQPFRV